MVAKYKAPKTYKEAVEHLVEDYVSSNNDIGDLEIYVFPDPKKKIVRVIQVSDTFPQTDDVWPFTFRESPEYPFKSSIAIATKGEWKRILKGKLEFQADWNMKKLKRVWPHDKK